MSDELAVTQGKAMREMREKGIVLPFPSGNNYRVRFPGAAGLLRRGNLPNPLLSFATDAFWNGVTQEKYDAFMAASDKAERAVEFMDSLRVICEAMFMQPRVVDEPQADDETSIEDVPIEDQVWAFRLTFKPLEVLYPFRAEPEPDVERVPEPENVPQTTE